MMVNFGNYYTKCSGKGGAAGGNNNLLIFT